ncbi:hypothetical protein HBO15_25350 [Pseudomonas sp. WS 5111]|uniref:hypothetical protein n=1 Tax=unclassified Pseudomonas TaxID=196821 RepID=UPI0014749D0A|nr:MULTISPECIES: hypothetical protein [unclassified Pseudomonas]NMX70689.1 hypothetical protein [Pseudomonas sp. WS 5111]NMX84890.1 hypothetical protein [Pseudomonas sp. WS 5010]
MKLTDPEQLLPPIVAGKPQEDQVKINPSGISQNTDTHIIGITEDKLHRILGDYQRGILSSQDWVAPLGICLTLATTLFTSEFRDFIIRAEYWRMIFICGASISFYLTATSLISRYRNRPLSIKELVDNIAGRNHLGT